MELLSVVLIIGILAAIAIPNVLSLSKRLQIAKLDEFARQIYLAAQNETVKMKASGRLNAFYIEVEETHKGDWSLESIDREPSDYPEGDTTWKLLYYIPFDDPMVHEYFMQAESSLNIATEKGGSFILELNPLTGDVYSVFYAEREDLKYHETWELESRERKDREAAKIGYYCGAAGNSAVVLPSRFDPKIEFTNEEELRVNITCPGMLRINGTQRKLNLLVTVTDESGDIWSKSYSGGSNELNIVGNTAQVSLLLDSVAADYGFADIVNGLTPGDDIMVKAEFTYTNGDIVIAGQTEGSVNSLFAYRRNEGSGVEIGVSCVRHLNNLRETKYVQENADSITIVQTNEIDFAAVSGVMDQFGPIVSKSLFENALVTYNGGGNLLRGFVIESDDGSGTGLFQSVKHCTLKNIRMADCQVKGGRLTGAVAGSADSAVLTNCGVFLTTKDTYGRHNDMDERIEKYKVTGTDSVGGIAGELIRSKVTNCFAAVSVEAAISAGGLSGKQTGGIIRNSYSSGAVKAMQNGGGLVGSCAGGMISSCYSTSDITVENRGGGLIGEAVGMAVDHSDSFGLVQVPEGAPLTGGMGGFAGQVSGGSAFMSCRYLRQAKYNDEFTGNISGVSANLFQELKSESVNPVENSEPYNSNLVKNAFPFSQIPYLDDSGGIMTHYGDWPEELKLQTSLVYYEKYREEDGTESYGYYAVTSLTMSGGEGEQPEEDVNTWRVDTLKDQYCVEDGYAVITPYALTSLDYRLNADVNSGISTVSIAVGDGAGKANLMESGVNLEFKRKGENGEETTYTISNSYIFRLPFELQMTDRKTASRFYDQLVLTGHVETNEVFTEYKFYYCPDFAKNAVNPSLSEKDAVLPADPNSLNGSYVYVRSARQLNALGRNSYYWNKQKNTGAHNENREFEFRQETDIDFGKYEKVYCGQTFNLMDTSKTNPYRNIPIGRPNEQGKVQLVQNNFRYVYDGGGHKIIDYCCVSDDNQFVGLFGEVQHGILKNIVMTASDPEDGSAYVKSSFRNGELCPGVGVLAGLLYVAKREDGDTYNEGTGAERVAAVINCSVSGYQVSYERDSPSANVALGGMIGYSFGKIERSSAVSKMVELQSPNGNHKQMSMGGLVGAVGGMGTVKSCYAGGNLRFKSKDIDAKSSIGGICGGYFKIYGYAFNINSAGISNSYSYCTWTKDEIDDRPNLSLYGVSSGQVKSTDCYYLEDGRGNGITLKAVDGVTGKSMKELSYLDSSELSGFDRAASDTSYPWPEDEAELSGSAYPFPAVVRMVEEDGSLTDYVHYGSWPSAGIKSERAYLSYYEKYADGSYGYYYINENGIIQRDLDDSDSKEIVDAGYGVLCSPQQNFEILYEAHQNDKLSHDYKIAATEALADKLSEEGAFNLYAFDVDFKKKYLDTFQGTQLARGIGINYINEDGMTVSQTLYINTKFAADIALQREPNGTVRIAEIRTPGQLQELNSSTFGRNWEFRQTHYMIAAETTGLLKNNSGGYSYDGQEHEIRGLKLPLFLESAGGLYNIRITAADISVNGDAAALAVSANFGESDIKNCTASGNVKSTGGSAAGLVGINGGSIVDSFTIINVSAAENAAGFVMTQNNGIIHNCFADTTASGKNAAGFIYSLTGGEVLSCRSKGSVTAGNGNAGGFGGNLGTKVSGSYSNCQVAGYNAAGFTYQANGGNITDCYSVGSVSARDMACGFLCYGWATIQSSYSVVSVEKGSTRYGFGSDQINNIYKPSYYWVSSDDFNDDIDDKSNAIKLEGFNKLEDGTVLKQLGHNWTLENREATVPDTMSGGYPYPRLQALAHYGDWPEGEEEDDDLKGTIGAFQVYYPRDSSPAVGVINGVLLELDDMKEVPSVVPYEITPVSPIVFGVLFSKDINLTGWKVVYRYNPGYSQQENMKEVPITAPDQRYFINLDTSLNAYTFYPDHGTYQMIDITFTAPDNSGKSYTFKYYEEGTRTGFKYVK